jgi:hypothetical protein
MSKTYHCPACKQDIALPEELLETPPTEALSLFRTGRKVDTIIALRTTYEIGLWEAKFITRHISEPKGSCANCKGSLLEDVITYCPTCGGLNFNW